MSEDQSAKSQLIRCVSWPLVALLVAAVIPRWSAAQPAPQSRVDVAKLGPQVGQRVPNFSLKDENGKTQTLHSIMGQKGAMLVFIRSADW